MLLTGFDAPVEQVMYLDKVVVAHNILQAIARVNRVAGEFKDKGFVVDYVGIGHHVEQAIDAYDEREQKEVLDTLSFPEDELRELEASFKAIMDLLHTNGLDDLNDHDAILDVFYPEDELRELEASFKAIMDLLHTNGLDDLNDHDAFFDVFYDEDLRFEFISAFNKLTRCLNLVFPAKQALDYMQNYQALAEINVLAGKHFRDQRLSMKGIPPKLRAITDQHLESKDIDVRVRPISILDENFVKEVARRSRAKTKAAEIEHVIRHHLDVELDDDPDLKASFAQALADIFENFRDNWRKIYEELEKLRARILNARNEPTYGLHRKKQMPFFRMIQRELFGMDPLKDDEDDLDTRRVAEPASSYGLNAEDRISLLVNLTQKVCLVIERELRLTGFWESIPARNRLKAEIQKTLLAPEFLSVRLIKDNRSKLISRAMEIAERNNDIILHAE